MYKLQTINNAALLCSVILRNIHGEFIAALWRQRVGKK